MFPTPDLVPTLRAAPSPVKGKGEEDPHGFSSPSTNGAAIVNDAPPQLDRNQESPSAIDGLGQDGDGGQ
jgi:hypothetical protein